MNLRQKKFAELYAQSGNAEQAAVGAGYSEKYARGNAYKLVAISGIAKYIRELTEKAQDERIMTVRERRAILSDIARDPEQKPGDRVRAIDALNKMTGDYITKVEGNISAEVSDPFEGLTTEELRKLAEGC